MPVTILSVCPNCGEILEPLDQEIYQDILGCPSCGYMEDNQDGTVIRPGKELDAGQGIIAEDSTDNQTGTEAAEAMDGSLENN